MVSGNEEIRIKHGALKERELKKDSTSSYLVDGGKEKDRPWTSLVREVKNRKVNGELFGRRE